MADKKKIDWSGDIRQRVIDAIKQRGAGGFATVRSVYYYLGTLNVIPLTAQGYKQLDALVVDMRKKGEIEWGYFDSVAGINGYSPSRYWEPEEFYNAYRDQFLNSSAYFDVPRWYRQHNYVEIWVEKKGLLHKVENMVSDLGVQVRAIGGYPAWEFVKENIDSIYEYLEDRAEDAEVNILYLGDLDPSGLDIDRQIQEAFDYFEMDIIFKRIGLLPNQVERYSLPPIPDSEEVIRKIHRDARYAKYISQYGERFTELDAWEGIAPETMKQEIRDAVWRLFDHGLDKEREQLQRDLRARLQPMLDDARKKLGA